MSAGLLRWHSDRTAKLGDEFKEPIARFVVAAGASSASVTVADTGGWFTNICIIQAVGADIRYNLNAAASATTFYIKNGDIHKLALPWNGGNNSAIHAIRNASTDGTLEIIVYKVLT